MNRARVSLRVARLFTCAMIVALSACGGGGSTPAASTPTPTPTPSFNVTLFASGTVGPAGPTPVQFPFFAGTLNGSVILPPASALAGVAMTLSSSPPSGWPSVQNDARLVRTLGVSVSAYAYLTAQSSATTRFATSIGAYASLPGVTFVSGNQYLLLYDPTKPAAGWIPISGPGSPPTGVLEGENKGALTLQQGVTYDLALVSTQGTLVVPPAVP